MEDNRSKLGFARPLALFPGSGGLCLQGTLQYLSSGISRQWFMGLRNDEHDRYSKRRKPEKNKMKIVDLINLVYDFHRASALVGCSANSPLLGAFQEFFLRHLNPMVWYNECNGNLAQPLIRHTDRRTGKHSPIVVESVLYRNGVLDTKIRRNQSNVGPKSLTIFSPPRMIRSLTVVWSQQKNDVALIRNSRLTSSFDIQEAFGIYVPQIL